MYVCFDIGGTFVKYGCLDENGTILLKGKFETINHLEKLLNKMKKITANYQKNFRIKGIGISVPGIIKNNGYLITAGAISSLYNVNLKQKLEEVLKLPVLVENDANSAALAEKWLGVAKELQNFVCLVLGTGIGDSIFINNQLYRGAHGVAGEFGWNVSSLTNTNNIELNSWNKKASIIDGLCNNYNNEVSLISSEFTPINDARMIFIKEKQGDIIAKNVLNQFFNELAIGILNIQSSLDPEAFIIGGGISESVEFEVRLNQTLQKLIKRHSSLNTINTHYPFNIKIAEFQSDAGLVGAAYGFYRSHL